MATETLPIHRPVNRTAEHIFFSSMAILLCVVVFIGFSPTYFRAGMLRAPLPSPILHFHGAVFTLWMMLFVVQTAFISARLRGKPASTRMAWISPFRPWTPHHAGTLRASGLSPMRIVSCPTPTAPSRLSCRSRRG